MWPPDHPAAMLIIDEGVLWPRVLIEQIAAPVILQPQYHVAAAAVYVCACVFVRVCVNVSVYCSLKVNEEIVF